MCDRILGSRFWYFLQERYKISLYSQAIDLVGDRDPVPQPTSFMQLCRLIVGAGASVGEKDPHVRLGLLAGRLGKVLSLTIKERRVLIACGAGSRFGWWFIRFLCQ